MNAFSFAAVAVAGLTAYVFQIAAQTDLVAKLVQLRETFAFVAG